MAGSGASLPVVTWTGADSSASHMAFLSVAPTVAKR